MALPPWLSLTCTVHWLPKVEPDANSTVREFAEKTRRHVAVAGDLRLDNDSSYRSHVELEKFFFGASDKVAAKKKQDMTENNNQQLSSCSESDSA
mmetsp:Transcript_2326/g.1910  ORF Transcript_2326/g.1910 Transcript_2326/m.1910 type:complete len:95 (-) Transcript_2326:54-338(-)